MYIYIVSYFDHICLISRSLLFMPCHAGHMGLLQLGQIICQMYHGEDISCPVDVFLVES